MKKIYQALCVSILLLSGIPLVARGAPEVNENHKIIKIADEVPGLITPGLYDGAAMSLISSVYEYLVEINTDDGSIQPVLATDWYTEDGSVWTLHLREKVVFHDGSEFDAFDVKYTLERTQNPTVGHLRQKDFEIIQSIDVLDSHTINIYLKEPRPGFIYNLMDYNIAILSNEYDYGKFGETRPMGTGPFKLDTLIPKESVVLKKFDHYWDNELPKVNALEIYFISDMDTAVSMLEQGIVDVVPFVTPLVKKQLETKDGFKVESPYQEQRFVSMAVDKKPFDDNRVRLAFKYSMDPHIIARSIAQTELNEGVFYDESPIMNMLSEHKELPLRERNIDKAKQLLREAGYPNGVTTELYFPSDHPFSKELAQSIKELAAPAGFTINLKGYPRDVYLSQYWLHVPISITGWGGRIDPTNLLTIAFTSDAPWNELHMKSATIDELVHKASMEVDYDTKVEYFHEIQDWFYEQGGLINIQVPLLIAMSDRIVNYRQSLTQITQYKYTDKK
ncbi:MAG: ABC transporter substrate-binding protein [Sphaerochaetaceae bacterium]|nr:ABC transporter substrate-binding protein [Sphaerochaetaceae bacterium]